MAVPAIRLDRLTKYYGAVIGIDGLTLDVDAGEVFGFLGANGAGKTTTIRILLDLLRPTSGSASVLGFDTQRQSLDARRSIGYLPGDMPIYPELSGGSYLAYLAALAVTPVSKRRLSELLQRFDISDLDLTRRMRDYSHGMKRKLGIVQALMTEAPVVILDEPTSGLDPLMIEAFSETIDEVAREGRATVFLSSHVLSEVERVCQRIALVRAGRLLATRSVRSLHEASSRRVTITFSRPVCANPDGVGAIVAQEPQRWVLDIEGPLGPLISRLNLLPVLDVNVSPFTLEDTVLRLMAEDERP
jgi:ABC-2 type transport system ATP-binding protein